MSYWDRPKPVRRARAVYVCDIAHIAVELLDEGGLRALTVRAVALRMDVAPASLYSRVTAVDDLFNLALDAALGSDSQLQNAHQRAGLRDLALAYYRHLVAHPWACQVIAMRAPRGPNYLHLSERMCVLLAGGGSADPLSEAYALSNFVIGSATTTPTVGHQRGAAVDAGIAPLFASLHAQHTVNAEAVLKCGLHALLTR